jgi:hypothetical protein
MKINAEILSDSELKVISSLLQFEISKCNIMVDYLQHLSNDTNPTSLDYYISKIATLSGIKCALGYRETFPEELADLIIFLTDVFKKYWLYFDSSVKDLSKQFLLHKIAKLAILLCESVKITIKQVGEDRRK